MTTGQQSDIEWLVDRATRAQHADWCTWYDRAKYEDVGECDCGLTEERDRLGRVAATLPHLNALAMALDPQVAAAVWKKLEESST